MVTDRDDRTTIWWRRDCFPELNATPVKVYEETNDYLEIDCSWKLGRRLVPKAGYFRSWREFRKEEIARANQARQIAEKAMKAAGAWLERALSLPEDRQP